MYLVELGVLEVISEGKSLSLDELRSIAKKLIPDIDLIYSTYKELRSQGLTVRSGLKYGADFALYRTRPGLEHAPYLVKVLRYDEEVDPGNLIGWGRISHSVRKNLLIAITYPGGVRKYIMLKWLRP